MGNLHFSVTEHVSDAVGNQICDHKSTKRWRSMKVKTKQYASGEPRVNSLPPRGSGVTYPQEEREGGRGKKQAVFHFLPHQWHSFLFSFCTPPHEPSPFSHIHFPLLMTRVGKFLQANPSSWVSRCRSVSCQRTLLTTAWGIQPIQLMSSYWRRDVPSIENLVSLLFAFSAKRKKKPQIGEKKKRKTCFCVQEHTHVCLSSKMTVLVRNRCKQERRTRKSLPPENPKGLESVVGLVFWLAQLAYGLNGERGQGEK